MEGVKFIDDISLIPAESMNGKTIHILCVDGMLELSIGTLVVKVCRHDYAIIVCGQIVSSVNPSPDWNGIVMSLDGRFVNSVSIRSNYGAIGFVSLVMKPVIRLSPSDFIKCLKDLERLRGRVAETEHLFHEELVAALLSAHILDLYDIHARIGQADDMSPRKAALLRQFMGMLFKGDYISHRDQRYYAESLCITPHYLSEICKTLSGQPFSYWIDRFLIQEALRLLNVRNLTLLEIAERLNFSSQSYFTRYIQKHTGLPPSAFR